MGRILQKCAALAAALVLATCARTSQDRVSTAELAAFADSIIPAEMAVQKIPGAAFVFVQNGRVVLERHYGTADIEHNRPVDANTIWRIGSISKLFTATAVMQLVDREGVELDAPVDRYVKRVSIPATYPEPVPVRHLLTHTAGFDEIRPGTQAATEDGVLPLADFLRDKLVRIRPPGRVIAYSTYGITLAGELVEEVSGLPFEKYLQRHILSPLAMKRSCITVPHEWQENVARGYELEGDSTIAQAWEWYHTTPASSVNATVSDMARFMIAHLRGRPVGRNRMLRKRAEAEMQRQQITMDPEIPGYALGFNEDFIGNLRVIEHGGNVAGFSALMVLI